MTLTVVSFLLSLNPPTTQAATLNTLNFQARLQTNPGGAVVPDGYYNVEFKIYNASSSSGSSQGSCTGDANCLWTETYYDSNGVTAGNDNRVRVSHGYLTVNLGSLTSFPAMNWDQNLYITMNVGGTTQTATPTWNGEMSPRLALSAVPYAFRAAQLATGNGTLQSTLSLIQPTVGDQVFQINDMGAAGTYSLLTGSGNKLGTTVIVGANDANALQFKAGNATVLTFGSAANIAYLGNAGTTGTAATPTDFTLNGTGSSTAATNGGKLTLKGGAGATTGTGSDGGEILLIGGTASGSNARVGGQVTITGGTPSATGAGGAVSVTSGAGGSTSGASGALSLATGTTTSGASGAVTIGTGNATGNSGGITIGTGTATGTPGSVLIKNGTNAANSFQVQNSAGTALLSVDSANGYVFNNGIAPLDNMLANPGFEAGTTAVANGWNFGTVTVDASNARSGNNEMQMTTVPFDNYASRRYAVVPGQQIYYEGYVKRSAGGSGTGGFFLEFTDENKANASFSSGDVFTDPGTSYTLRSNKMTVPAGKYYMRIAVTVRSGATGTWYYDDLYLASATQAAPLIVQNTANSTAALQVQNASGNEVVTVNTSTGSVILGKASTVNAVMVFQNSSNANTITLQSGATSAGGGSGYTLTLPTALGSSGDCLKDTGSGVLGFGGCTGTTDITGVGTFVNGNSYANGATISSNNIIFGEATASNPGMVTASTQTFGGNKTFTGVTSFQNASNSNAAFQVQNSSATTLLGVGTTSLMSNLLSNGDFETATTSWSNKTGGTLSRVTAATTPAGTYYGQAGGHIVLTGSGGGAAHAVSLTLSSTYTLSFYARMASGTATNISAGYTNTGGDQDCLTNQTVVSTGFTRFTCTFTVTTTAGTAIYVKQSSAVSQTIYIDALQVIAGTGAYTPFSLGTLQLNGAITTPVVLQNTNDSTTALQIQNSAGTSNTFVVDTLNNRIGIGVAAPTTGFQVANNTLFKNTSDSTAAFQIQDSSAGALFTADTTNGQLIIGQKADTSGTDSTWTRVSDSTAGVVKTGGTSAITGIYSSVVYNGSLYVGTIKSNAAEVYRYDGSGAWTVINTTAGRFNTTTSIDAIAGMVVYNGSLYIGTQETAKAELYRYDGGTGTSVFTVITSTTAGTIAGGLTAYDVIRSMAVFNGKLYFGANKNDASVIAYYGGNGTAGTDIGMAHTTAGQLCGAASPQVDQIDSMVAAFGTLYIGVTNGGSGAVVCALHPTGSDFVAINNSYGTFAIETGGTITGIDNILAMTVYNGRLTLALSDNLGVYVVEVMQASNAGTDSAVFFRRLNNAAGQLISGGTSSILQIWTMTVYNGSLFVGTYKANAGEIWRYNSGFSTTANWTKVSQSTAGIVSAAGGATTNIDLVITMQPFNNRLYAGTYDATSNNAEVYENYVVSSQSYALTFQASAGSTQQSGFPNQGSISFLGDGGPNSGAAINTSGAFLFSSGIITSAGAYDVAEDYATRDESLQPGDVVAADPGEQEMVIKAKKASDTIVGVYSEKPALRLSQADTTINGGRAIPVALAGRVPVKVSSKNGVIKPGDLLTMSDIPGVAMKATKAGFIIGRSLGFYSDADPAKTGKVMTFMNLSWYDPTIGQDTAQGTSQAQNSTQTQLVVSNDQVQGSSVDMLSVMNLSADQLVVTNDATFKANVTILGKLAVTDLTLSGHIATSGKAPKLELQPYAGSDAINAIMRAKATLTGNDTGGEIILTAGDLPQDLQPGAMLKVTFDRRYSSKPRVMLTPNGAAAARLGLYVEQATNEYFIIAVVNPAAAGTDYDFSYYIFQ